MRKNSDAPRIEFVDAGSDAAAAGLAPRDTLLSVNGHAVRDLLDFRFHSADSLLRCVFAGARGKIRVRIPGDRLGTFGFRLEPMRFRACGNHCLFCFTDQNPRGLRPSLYFKDEDYRLSFLFGNYVTLTHVHDADLQRIAEQRLSPLYVSIHAADETVRRRMLGIRRDDRLLEKIRFLAKQGIEMHGQVVLCPGLNDGPVLTNTVETAAALYPAFRSLAVVPVGLTGHRRDLPRLRPVDASDVLETLRLVRPLQARFLNEFGEPFVYCADEFYLLAGRPIPSASHYGDFWQADNGVGMVRAFLSEFSRSRRSFPKSLAGSARFVVVTGSLASPVLRKTVLPVLNRISNARFELVEAPNRFFGKSVTVSGLLVGRDILAATQKNRGAGTVLLPSNCLNADGLFLDGWTVDRLTTALRREVRVLDSFNRFWER